MFLDSPVHGFNPPHEQEVPRDHLCAQVRRTREEFPVQPETNDGRAEEFPVQPETNDDKAEEFPVQPETNDGRAEEIPVQSETNDGKAEVPLILMLHSCCRHRCQCWHVSVVGMSPLAAGSAVSRVACGND